MTTFTAVTLLLALCVVGAVTTRSVYLLGFRAGTLLERSRQSLARSVAVLEAAERGMRERP